ncbi:MAG TPA: GNAT family N-acetyltransferase [Gaiellaceae bacterium]|nr:GNAT family N-acetyltransferase [Gaiellaceae bacterium]
MDIDVSDNPAELRYELRADGELVGEIRYRRIPDGLALIHTQVEPRRTGLGSVLVQQALDDMRSRGLRLVPICPFVRAYIKRHPEYEDLVTADDAVPE